jgi:enoyl-[acyl-carrier protein] reductase I
MEGRAGAMLTLTYIGAQRAFPNYNVMGLAKASLEANVRYMAYNLGPKNIRVNAISAGPVRTLAASGIKNFKTMLSEHETLVPLKRNIDPIDVGNTAAFLCSDLGRGITGDIVYVDSGYHIL